MTASLRDFRLARKISLRQLSKEIGVHSTHLARVEKGLTVPNVVLALRLARALNVQFAQLLADALRSSDEEIG